MYTYSSVTTGASTMHYAHSQAVQASADHFELEFKSPFASRLQHNFACTAVQCLFVLTQLCFN